jgi:hypothetical protein
MLPAAFIVAYQRVRDQLITLYPEMSEDPILLSDTLEGMFDTSTVIASFIRRAREDEANADALSVMIKDMGARKSRLQDRADKCRASALAMMDAIGIRKLEQPDFTASIRSVPPKVEIEDETAIPDHLCKITRTPDKTKLKEALSFGPVEGARMSNGSETLSLRTT